jgi:hypothetical protein
MPSLRDKAHAGVLCTFRTRTSATAAGFARSSQLNMERSVREGGMDLSSQHNVTRLGHSPTASQAASGLGHLSSLRPHWWLRVAAVSVTPNALTEGCHGEGTQYSRRWKWNIVYWERPAFFLSSYVLQRLSPSRPAI